MTLARSCEATISLNFSLDLYLISPSFTLADKALFLLSFSFSFSPFSFSYFLSKKRSWSNCPQVATEEYKLEESQCYGSVLLATRRSFSSLVGAKLEAHVQPGQETINAESNLPLMIRIPY